MGRKTFRKILALLVMVFGAVTVFGACNKDPYKKMKLEVDKTSVNVTYDEKGDNAFSLSATVSGVGKKVSTDVEWVIEDKSVVLPISDNYVKKDGNTSTASFYATTTGGPTYITVRTIEGGLSERIKVNVDIPIKNLAFNLATLPIERNVKTDITTKFDGGTTELYNRITFTPEYTTQKDVKLEVVGMNGEDISEDVEIDGNFITVKSESLTEFKLKATSRYNTALTTTANVVVLNTITADGVVMKQRNSSSDEVSVMDVVVENGVKYFSLDLANMGEPEARKVLFADFSGVGTDFNGQYSLGYSVKSESSLPFRISSGTETNQYVLDTGFGTNTGYINFHLNYKGYEQYFAPKFFPVKVNVSTFPDKLYFTNYGDTKEITSLRIFKNYNNEAGYFGEKIVLNIKNGDIVVGSQTAKLSVINTNTGEEVVNGVKLFTMSSNNVRTEITPDTHVKHGTTIYVAYDYNQLSPLLGNANTNIVLRATSVVKNTIVSDNLVFKFVKGDVYPSLKGYASPVIELPRGESVTLDNTVLDDSLLENGLSEYKMSLSRGLNDIVSVEYDENQDVWNIISDIAKPLNHDSTVLTITTPNGFSLSVTVRVLEKYTKENLFFRVGENDYPVYNDTADVVTNNLYLSTNSIIEIKIGYIQEGKKYIFDNLPTNLIFADVEYTSSIISVDISNLIITTLNTTGESPLEYVINSKFFDSEEDLYINFNVNVAVRITGFGITNEKGQSVSAFSLISKESIYHEDAEVYKAGRFNVLAYPNNAEIDIDNIAWKLNVKDVDSYTLSEYTEIKDKELNVVGYSYKLNNSKFEIEVIVSDLEDNRLVAEIWCKYLNYDKDRLEATLTFVYTQKFLETSIDNSDGKEVVVTHDSASLKILVSKAIKTTEIALDRTEVLFNLNQLYLDEYGIVQDKTRNKVSGVYSVRPSSTSILVPGVLLYYTINGDDTDVTPVEPNASNVYTIADGVVTFRLDEKNLSFSVEIERYDSDYKNITIHFVPKDSVDTEGNYNPLNIAWGHLDISFRDGNSEATAYKVSDAYDLQFINNDLDAYYRVTNNIYISEDTIWRPIGANHEEAFSGHFDGGNYIISGLNIVRTATTSDESENAYNAIYKEAGRYSIYYGLFGYIANGAELKDFSLRNITFRITYSGSNEADKSIDVYMGALAGYSEGSITNISIIDDPNFEYNKFNGTSLNTINATKVAENTDDTTETGKKSLAYAADALGIANSNNLYFGGVVGVNAGRINDIVSNVTMYVRDQQINPSENGITTAYVGGIAGVNFAKNELGIIENSEVVSLINASLNDAKYKSSIFNPNSTVGGVVGANSSSYISTAVMSRISNIDVRTVIFALNNVGGVAGQNFGLVDNVTVQPTIVANKNVGGVAGLNARLGTNQIASHGEGLSHRFVVNTTTNDIDVVGLSTSDNHAVFGAIYHSKVQFVDRMDSVSFMNTGIIASENVGGVVGYNYDLMGYDCNLTHIDDISNMTKYGSIVYTSVHSYFSIDPSSPNTTRRSIATVSDEELLYLTSLRLSREAKLKAKKDAVAAVDASQDKIQDSVFYGVDANEIGWYYGDIIILPNTTNSTNVYAGGVVGFADGKSVVSGSNVDTSNTAGICLVHVYSNINVINHSNDNFDIGYTLSTNNYYKYTDVTYGGLLGKTKGSLFVYNANVLGTIANTLAEKTGGFVGDASEILDRMGEVYKCDPYVIDSNGFLIPNTTKDKFKGVYNINNSYTLLKNSAGEYIKNFAAIGEYKKVTASSGVGISTTTFDVKYSTYVSTSYDQYTNMKQITASVRAYSGTTGSRSLKVLTLKKQFYEVQIGTEEKVLEDGTVEIVAIYETRYRFVFTYDGTDYVYESITFDETNQSFALDATEIDYDIFNVFHQMLYYIAVEDASAPGNISNKAYTDTTMNLLTASNSYYVGFEATFYGYETGIADVEFDASHVNSLEVGKENVSGTDYAYSYYPYLDQKWHYTNLIYDDLIFDEYFEGDLYHLVIDIISNTEHAPSYTKGDILIAGGGNINPSVITASYNVDDYLNEIYVVEETYINAGINASKPSGQYLYYNSTVNGGVPISFGAWQNANYSYPKLIIDLAPEEISVEETENDNYNMDNVDIDTTGNKVDITEATDIRPIGVIVEKGNTYKLIDTSEKDKTQFAIDIKSLPEFVGYSSINIVSSDERVVLVEKDGEKFSFKAVGEGYSVLTITTELNNSLKQEIVVFVREKAESVKYSYVTNSATEEIEDGTARVLKGSNSTFNIALENNGEDYYSNNIGVEYTITGVDSITIDGEVYSKNRSNIKAVVLGYSHIFKVIEDFEVSARPFFIYTIEHEGNTYSYRQYIDQALGEENANITYDVVQTSFAYNVYAPNNIENGVAETATFDVLVKSNDDLLVPVYVTIECGENKYEYVIKQDITTSSGLAFYTLGGGNESDSIEIEYASFDIIGLEYDAIRREHSIQLASHVLEDNYQYFTNHKVFDIKFAIKDTYDGVIRDDKFDYTILPFAIEDVKLTHYTKFFYDKDLADETTNTGVTEEDYRSYKYASNKIVPGNSSLFEIRITPFYAQHDYVTVEIVGDNTNKSIIQQVLEGLISRNNISGISNFYQYPYFSVIDGRSNYIKIDNKYSYFKEDGKYDPVDKTQLGYDGLIYLALTLDSSFEGKKIEILVKGYRESDNGDVLLFEKALPLDVVAVPRINITWDTTSSSAIADEYNKLATVNIDGKLPINLTFSNAEASSVKWEVEDNLGEVVYEDGAYVFKLNKIVSGIKLNDVRKVFASVNSIIDGVNYVASATLEFQIVPFLLQNIYFKDSSATTQDTSPNKSLSIHFNHTKDFLIGINAIYDVTKLGKYCIDDELNVFDKNYCRHENPCVDLAEYVSTFIKGFEDEITEEFHATSEVNPYIFKNEIKITSGGADLSGTFLKEGNFSTRGYSIKRSGSIFNITIAESRVLDKFLSQVAFDYNTTSDGDPLEMWANNVHEHNPSNLNVIMTAEVNISVVPLSGDDHPMPIKSVDDLRNMQAGVSYILVNDLVLTNWTPIDGVFKTFDGNGHTITISSFGDVKGLTEIGLFTHIGDDNVDSYVTTIKNLTIDICPLTITNEDKIIVSETGILTADIGSTEGVSFGILAGVNNGIITNVNVTNNASDIRAERKATLSDLDVDGEEGGTLYNEKYFPVVIDEGVYNTYFSNTATYEEGLSGDKAAVNIDLYHMIDTISVVTENSQRALGLRVGGLVGINTQAGYITNSSISNINVKGSDYVAGFAGINAGYISSSFFKGGSVISNEKNTKAQAITAGFVAQNMSGKIQYCYVLGAENRDTFGVTQKTISYTANGNLATATEDNTTYIDINSNLLYINKNSETDKLEVDLSAYAGYNFYKDYNANDEYKYISQFRALGSVVYTNNYASGFVGENKAYISNSYSNLVVYGTYAAGFTINNSEGNIEHCYTMCSIENSDNTQYPFARVSGKINSSFYLLMSRIDNLPSKGDVEDYYFDKFSNASSQDATQLSANAFQDYNTFTAWAFNSDYSNNVNIMDGVWFIPQATYESDAAKEATQNTYNEYFKEDDYTPLRPELVSANLQSISLKFFLNTSTGDSDDEDLDTTVINWEYIEVPKWKRSVKDIEGNVLVRDVNIAQGSINNPLLVSTAEEFNLNCGEPKTETGVPNMSRKDAVRMIHDISFNNIDQTANTYNVDYIGNFEGNGLSVNNLRISADNEDTAVPADGVTRLGLFRRIASTTEEDPITNTDVIIVGNVRNLNLNIVEINGSNVNMVGVLAGSIDSGRVYNIVIDDAEENVKVEGLNAVGGLAGYISGDAEVVNVTSNVSVKANAINQYNTFSYKNPNKPNNQFKMFVSNANTRNVDITNVSSTLAETIRNTSYVGAIAGIIDVNTNPDTNSALSNINNIDRIRQCNVDDEVKLSAEVVGGIAGFVGKDTYMSSCAIKIHTNSQLNASRIAGGVVGQNQGFINRIAIEYSNQKEIDAQFIPKTDNTKNDETLYNKYDNPTNNDEANVLNVKQDTFTNNAHYIGGIAGVNIGGYIHNSYSRINVVNVSAQYAGGIIGLNIGAPTTEEVQFDQLYSTGSVYAFYAYGGIIGYQPYVEVLETAEKYRFVDEVSFEGKGINSYANNVKDLIESVYGITPSSISVKTDTKGTTKTVLDIKTTYSNIVGANIWRRIDLNTNRTQYYGGHAPAIVGTFVGYTTLSYNGSDIKDVDLSISKNPINERMIHENSFFKQTFKYSSPNNLVPEIGNAELLAIDYTDVKKESITNFIVYKNNTKEYFITGDYENDGLTYRFSRLAYYGSMRTLNEMIHRTYLIGDNRNGANSIYTRLGTSVIGTSSGGEHDLKKDTVTTNIYRNWNAFNWNGVRLGTNQTIYNDIQGVRDLFPSLVNNIQPAVVYVYTEEDLKLMHSYRNAKFILQNDIMLTQAWEPVGTYTKPFNGELCSSISNGAYNDFTIRNLNIDRYNNDYFGFVAVSAKSNFHHFNIEYSTIKCNKDNDVNSTIAGAVLLGYAKNGEKSSSIHNVDIFAEKADSYINIYSTRYVGGLVGLAENVAIYNCSVKGFVEIKEEPTKTEVVKEIEFTSSMALDKNSKLSYHFGLLAGHISVFNNVESTTPQNIVDGIKIIIDNSEAKTVRDYEVPNNTNINIGGMYGTILEKTGADKTELDINILKDSSITINFVPFDESAANSIKNSVNHINIGGMIGNVVDTTLNSITMSNFDINYTNENKVIGAINIGGVVGYGSGIVTNAITRTTSDITVTNALKRTTYSNRIGGVFGYIDDSNNTDSDYNFVVEKAIKVNNSKIALNGLTEITLDGDSYYIGGFAGEGTGNTFGYVAVDNGTTYKNDATGEVEVTGKTDIIEFLTAPFQNAYVGGVYGKLNGGNVGFAYAIGNIYSNNGSASTAAGSTSAKRYIGGIIGYAGETVSGAKTSIDNVASDVDIVDSQYNSASLLSNVGGVVGVSIGGTATGEGNVITNSHSTGKIYVENNILNTNATNTSAGGIVGYASWTNIDNTYSATQILLGNVKAGSSRNAYLENAAAKGGIVGSMVGAIGLNVDHSYYVQDFVPYGTSAGIGVEYDEMMVEALSFGVNRTEDEPNPSSGLVLKDERTDTDIFTTGDNRYPTLAWIEKIENASIYCNHTNTVPFVLKNDADIEKEGVAEGTDLYMEANLRYSNKTIYFIGSKENPVKIMKDAGDRSITINPMTTIIVDGGLETNATIYNHGTIIGSNNEFLYDSSQTLGKNSYITGTLHNDNTETTDSDGGNIINIQADIEIQKGYVYASYITYNKKIEYIYNSIVNYDKAIDIVNSTEDVGWSKALQTLIIAKTEQYIYNFSSMGCIFDLTFDESKYVDKFMNTAFGTSLGNAADVSKYWTMIAHSNSGRLVHSWMYKDKYFDTILDNEYRYYEYDKDEANIDDFSIDSIDDLVLFKEKVNAGEFSGNIQLNTDIDLGAELWMPIGTKTNPFTGTFDGGGHTISNMRVMGDIYNGLFGVTKDATIKNLRIKDAQVAGYGNLSRSAVLIGQSIDIISLEKVGVEDAHIAGNNIAGLIGSLDRSKDSQVSFQHVYAVVAEGESSMGNYYAMLVGDSTIDPGIEMGEVYAAEIRADKGNSTYEINEYSSYFLSTKTIDVVSNNSVYLLTKNSSNSTKAVKKSKYEMQTEMLEGFNWSEVWVRESTKNYGLPTLKFEIGYWIDEGKILSELEDGEIYKGMYDGAEVELIAPAYDADTKTYTIIYPHHLAWVAYQVNELGKDFEGERILISQALDLSSMIWSPIGTEEVPFKGTVSSEYIEDTKSTLKISNMTTYGNYKTTFTEVKDLNTGFVFESRDVNTTYGGLFGNFEGMLESNQIKFDNAVVHNTEYAGVLAGNISTTRESLPITTLQGIDIKGHANVGGLVGMIVQTDGSKITEITCNVTDAVIAVHAATNEEYGLYVGGVVGHGTRVKIQNSTVLNASISAKVEENVDHENYIFAGGITGYVDSSKIFNCQFGDDEASSFGCATLTSNGSAGGIVAEMKDTELYACLSFGSVYGRQYVGGVVGHTTGSKSIVQNVTMKGEIDSAYHEDAFYVDTYTGGIVGYMENGYLSEAVFIGILPSAADNYIYAHELGGVVGYHKAGNIVNIYSDVLDFSKKSYTYSNRYGYLVGKTDAIGSISMAVLQCDNNCAFNLLGQWSCKHTGLIGNEVGAEYSLTNLTSTITTSCRIHNLLDKDKDFVDYSDGYKAYLYSSSWQYGFDGTIGTLSLKKAEDSTLVSKYHIYKTNADGTMVLDALVPYEIKASSDQYVLQVKDLEYYSKYVRYRYGYQSDITINIASGFNMNVDTYEPIGINEYYPFKGTINGGNNTILFMKKINLQHTLANGTKEYNNVGLIGYSIGLKASDLTLKAEESGDGFRTLDDMYSAENMGGLVGCLSIESPYNKEDKSISYVIDNINIQMSIMGYVNVGGMIGKAIIIDGSEAKLKITKCDFEHIMEYDTTEKLYIVKVDNAVGTQFKEVPENNAKFVGGLIGYASGYELDTTDFVGTINFALNGITGNSTQGTVGGQYNLGGIVGYAKNTYFEGCIVKATDDNTPNIKYSNITDTQGTYAGGIAGETLDTCIKECRIDGVRILANIDDTGNDIGGVVGRATNSVIEDCYMPYNEATNSTIEGASCIGGIVGRAYEGTTIKSCGTYEKLTITMFEYAKSIGGIVGCLEDESEVTGTLDNPTVSRGTIKSVEKYTNLFIEGGIGGIVGILNDNGVIEYCENELNIKGENLIYRNSSYKGVGGILGLSKSESVTISNCDNKGNVMTRLWYVGGILGSSISGNIDISEATNYGNITGNNYVGGIIGSGIDGKYSIINCEVSGATITGYEYVGGIIGELNAKDGTEFKAVFGSDSTVNGEDYTGGLIGSAVNVKLLSGTQMNGKANLGRQTTEITDLYCGGLIGYDSDCDFNAIEDTKALGDSAEIFADITDPKGKLYASDGSIIKGANETLTVKDLALSYYFATDPDGADGVYSYTGNTGGTFSIRYNIFSYSSSTLIGTNKQANYVGTLMNYTDDYKIGFITGNGTYYRFAESTASFKLNDIYYEYDFICCGEDSGTIYGTYTISEDTWGDDVATASLVFKFNAYIYDVTRSMSYTTWAMGGNTNVVINRKGEYKYSNTLYGTGSAATNNATAIKNAIADLNNKFGPIVVDIDEDDLKPI